MAKKSTSPLPNDVLVMGRAFAVVHCDPDDLDDAAGTCLWYQQKCMISNSLPKETEIGVVAHEIMHAYDDVVGIGLKENQIQSLAVVLVDLVRHNPHLVKYLTNAPAHEETKNAAPQKAD